MEMPLIPAAEAPEVPSEVPDHELPEIPVASVEPAAPTHAADETALLPSSSYHHNGYSSDSRAHYSSRSVEYNTPTHDSHPQEYHSQPSYSPLTQQPQHPPTSRPGSGLSNGPGQHGLSQPTPDLTAAQKPSSQQAKNSVVIKVGMVGDAQIGKTSLMVKYVEGSWDEDYIQTLGVNFMEKTISIRNTEITFSIWDLGGQREFVNMLPLVCNDAVAILFMFDLTRKSTLNSIKEWYRQGRGFNKTAIPFLVGTKYDHFVNFPREDQEEISIQAKRFAKAMKASLIFSSTSHSINVQKIFKIVLAKAFDLKCTIPEIENIGEPLLLYKNV
ncbi:hypothetical protein P175DRAFT_0489611 [Aspergillus ochraceoroseus IBT 24754]|uniref:GTP binding protein n=3 Tax=Aspergillus subgen. Nidulantes TaxID=2720870 RepID=A0A0F8V126_9EURO|nr:uncharacterized protein P175DRAFT_0489611 [Aspergillus ochraceoroseus IBT 24754]KKK22686.1 GTP binding protein [Aspergillus ochraceoroseus]KKK25488.1 GTP binding protein [Aspergillus rambellii]PTU24496.1 hypothetical protein P175DRAFT_0489611 [Aspergillus ochraceoroseus IBT 24754]